MIGDTPKLDMLAVLDKGYVRVQEVYGNDHLIVRKAKTSRGKDDEPFGDLSLVSKLIEWKHMTPFEFCHIGFKIKMPIMVERQMYTYRTRVALANSMRYMDKSDAQFYLYYDDNDNLLQGSDEVLQPFMTEMAEHYARGLDLYKRMVAAGVRKERARGVFPLDTYVTVQWQMNLRNWMHLLYQRTDVHAQPEIRCYADTIAQLIKLYFPATMSAFELHYKE